MRCSNSLLTIFFVLPTNFFVLLTNFFSLPGFLTRRERIFEVGYGGGVLCMFQKPHSKKRARHAWPLQTRWETNRAGTGGLHPWRTCPYKTQPAYDIVLLPNARNLAQGTLRCGVYWFLTEDTKTQRRNTTRRLATQTQITDTDTNFLSSMSCL